MKSNRLAALAGSVLLAGGLAVSPAQAADFGGDCCADLEERVAVLEATAARKGNRKVSLTITGLVFQQLMIWDDGVDSDAYVVGNIPDAGSHIQFHGSAKIDHDKSAGFLIRIHIDSDNSYQTNQQEDDASIGTSGLFLTQANMWIQSEKFGRLSWGLMHPAADNVALLDLAGLASSYQANFAMHDGPGFRLRNAANPSAGFVGTANWGSITHCNWIGGGVHSDCDGAPMNLITYDSPTIAGFRLSASWGENDMWDVALRYSGEFGDFKVLASAAYSEQDDVNNIAAFGTSVVDRVQFMQAAVAFMHTPTGIFASVAYGHEEADTIAGSGVASIPDTDVWYIKAGVRQRWNSYGATILYGEYGKDDDGFNASPGIFGMGTTVTGSDFDRYGAGIIQEIDAASMAVWVKWKHFEGDVSTTTGNIEFEDIDFFGLGGLITF